MIYDTICKEKLFIIVCTYAYTIPISRNKVLEKLKLYIVIQINITWMMDFNMDLRNRKNNVSADVKEWKDNFRLRGFVFERRMEIFM